MTGSKPRRPHGAGAYVAMMGAVLVIALVAGAATAFLDSAVGVSGFWVTVGVLAVTMLLTLWLAFRWWLGIDEAAREAHKWAWWWGGSGGMAVGMVLLLSLSLSEQSPVALDRIPPADLVSIGMMAILLFQLAGYTLAWAAWWLRHR